MTVFKLNKISALCGCLALASVGVHANTYDLQTAVTGKVLANTSSGISYKGRVLVPKAELAKSKDVFSISFKSDDKSVDGTVTIPQIAAKAWNDPGVGSAANPANVLCSATVTTNCIATTDATPFEDGRAVGWTHNSNWYLVDLTALDNGKYDVSIKLENNNDGTSAVTTAAAALPTMVYSADLSKETSALKVDKDGTPATTGAGFYLSKAGSLPTTGTDPATDDDFIPGFTVWDGYQSSGIFAAGHWYPNRHQTTVSPFWGNMLKPELGLVSKDLPKTPGYDTAADNANKNAAEVVGTLNLTSAVTSTSSTKGNRYLTIALGGDHRLAATKDTKNYKLTVTVTKK